MKVSVIIPCYNPSDFLLEALASVFAQTRPAHEVLVVNDGSTDATIFGTAQQQFPDMTLINLSENRGVAHARNLGIAHASGEVITFLDQDDRWVLEKLERQVAYLEAHPEYDYVTSRQRYFLQAGMTETPTWVKPEHINADLPGFLPGTLAVHRRAFEEIGAFNAALTAGTDDVDWFFRANAAKLVTKELPDMLLEKRIHSGNLSVKAGVHNNELLAVVRANMQKRKQADKISVIIPCYNGRKYIAEALASVAAQGELVGEIIVVDDASTDGSAEYVEGLNLPKVSVHRLLNNKGIGGARNAGIALAQSPFLAFLDADDLWPEGCSQALLHAMKSTHAPWAFGAIEHFGNGDKYALPPTQTGYFASAMLIRAEFLRKVGVFNEALRVGEFIDWFDRARRHHVAPAVTDTIVLKRRIHGENSSIVAGNKNANDYLKVARAAIERRKQRAEA